MVISTSAAEAGAAYLLGSAKPRQPASARRVESALLDAYAGIYRMLMLGRDRTTLALAASLAPCKIHIGANVTRGSSCTTAG